MHSRRVRQTIAVLRMPFQPFLPPARHLLDLDVGPEADAFFPGGGFGCLELAAEGVTKPPVGVRLAVANQIQIEVVRIRQIQVRQQAVVFVARLRAIQAERERLAFGAAFQVVGRLFRPIVRRGRAVEVHLRRIDAEQSHVRFAPDGVAHDHGVAIDHVRHEPLLLVELLPVVAVVLEVSEAIEQDGDEDGDQRHRDRPPRPPPPAEKDLRDIIRASASPSQSRPCSG